MQFSASCTTRLFALKSVDPYTPSAGLAGVCVCLCVCKSICIPFRSHYAKIAAL